MKCFYIFHIAAFSVLFPFTVSMIRLGRFTRKYLPLILLLSTAVLNDMISYIRIRLKSTNMVNSNVYVLVEFLMILWLASRWTNGISKKLLISVAVLGSMIWISDNLVLHSLYSNNSGFRLVASLGIVWISIEKLTDYVFFNRPSVFKRADLLLSLGFLFFFTFKAFVEAFHVFPMPMSKLFYQWLWVLLAVFDIITNLLFCFAILCIQRIQPYSTHYLPDWER